jgi:hypothetical protein
MDGALDVEDRVDPLHGFDRNRRLRQLGRPEAQRQELPLFT